MRIPTILKDHFQKDKSYRTFSYFTDIRSMDFSYYGYNVRVYCRYTAIFLKIIFKFFGHKSNAPTVRQLWLIYGNIQTITYLYHSILLCSFYSMNKSFWEQCIEDYFYYYIFRCLFMLFFAENIFPGYQRFCRDSRQLFSEN